jgi:HKD family nuclease
LPGCTGRPIWKYRGSSAAPASDAISPVVAVRQHLGRKPLQPDVREPHRGHRPAQRRDLANCSNTRRKRALDSRNGHANTAEPAMKLLINNYEAELSALAAEAVEIKVLIAFLTEAGLTWLPKEQYPNSQFIVGIGLGITSAGALKTLQAGGADVQVFDDPNRLFHPKVVYVKTAKSEHLIVGSNNLTFAGISSNYEVSTLSERNAQNDGAFLDFLAHFDYLKFHDFCGPANDEFYSKYSETKVQSQLFSKIPQTSLGPRVGTEKRNPSIDSAKLTTLGEFLRRIAREFPQLERHQGMKIADHDLKRFNEKKFLPLFAEIVEKASGGRLEAYSELSVGGHWRIIPIIQALDEQREPWDKAETCGRAELQVHFSQDFSKVYFSLVLKYTVDISIKEGQMPQPVRQRYDRIFDNLKDYREDAKKGLACFKNWNYPGKVNVAAWSQPLLSYEYKIESLPPDGRLCFDLMSLATALNNAHE